MSKIREYYQPLYDAISEYREVHNKWKELNRVYKYLDERIDKRKKLKKKKFEDYLGNASKKRKKAWENILSKNAIFFVIYLVGMLFGLWLITTVTTSMIVMSIILGIGGLGVYNRTMIPDALEKERIADMLYKYQEKRGTIDDKNVGDTLDSLRWELFQLRQKEKELEEYIGECEDRLLAENTSLANEILESHGIDAMIDFSPRLKQLRVRKDRQTGDEFNLWKN